MILFFGMQLMPLIYGILYVVHSVRKRRWGQGIAICVLLLLFCASLSVLLWEFLTIP